MAAQHDLYRLPDGPLVVILQGDLLGGLATRIVAPLLMRETVKTPLRSLNPVAEVGEQTYYIMPQLAATLVLGELGEKIGSLSVHLCLGPNRG